MHMYWSLNLFYRAANRAKKFGVVRLGFVRVRDTFPYFRILCNRL